MGNGAGTRSTLARMQNRRYGATPKGGLKAALAHIEPAIAMRGREFGYVFTPAGVQLKRYDSLDENVNTVTLPNKDSALLYGSIFTHNHPNNSAFSDGDIKGFIYFGLQEMRAVGDQYTYILSQPHGVAPFAREDFAHTWRGVSPLLAEYGRQTREALAAFDREHPNAYATSEGSKARNALLRSYERDNRHAFLQDLARRLNLDYQRIPTKGLDWLHDPSSVSKDEFRQRYKALEDIVNSGTGG